MVVLSWTGNLALKGLLVQVRSLIISLLFLFAHSSFAEQTHGMKAFGQCLAERGAVMYSAWWCPYCYLQLKEFDGTLARRDMRDAEKMKAFPFMKDCGGKEPGTLIPSCVPKEARGVPMWVFKQGVPPDGSTGETYRGGGFPLTEISRLSGCTLPE